jgi:hypothetical protein
VEFLAVVIVAFLFGMASAPFGLALDLPPAVVAVGVFAGCGAFAGTATAVLWKRRDQLVARRPGWVGIAVPVVGWMWRRAGTRLTGQQGTVVIDRAAAILDRLGVRGTGLVGPVLGRWTLPIAGVALDVDRRRLLGWHLTGVAIWSTVVVVGFDQLISALR